MKTRTIIIFIYLLTMISCDFRNSVYKDLKTGMITKGKGLSCEDVFLTIGEMTIYKNTFIYGDVFKVNFKNIEGFESIDGHVFPGMSLIVTKENGDTLLKNNDIYADLISGTNHSPLLLTSEVTVAYPIHSNGKYTLDITIWDKKGDGVFTAKLDFDVIPNDRIEIEPNQVTYDEIYLYSQKKRKVITDNIAGFGENIYIMLEGLEGFKKEENMVNIGLSMTVMDAKNNLIVNEENLMGNSGLDYTEFHSQLAPNFILSGTQVSNPIKCDIIIWDKRGVGSIKVSTQLNIE